MLLGASNFGVDEILAIVGGIYLIARAIVFITPTKRDDKALDGVNTWLATLKVITGLSLNQGINETFLRSKK